MSMKSIYELLEEARKGENPFADKKGKEPKAKEEKSLDEKPTKAPKAKDPKPQAKPKVSASGLTKEVSKPGLTHLNSVINKLGFEGKVAELTIDDLLVLKAHIIAVLESSGVSVSEVTSLVTQMAQMISKNSGQLSDAKAKEIVDTSYAPEQGDDGEVPMEEPEAPTNDEDAPAPKATITDPEKFDAFLKANNIQGDSSTIGSDDEEANRVGTELSKMKDSHQVIIEDGFVSVHDEDGSEIASINFTPAEPVSLDDKDEPVKEEPKDDGIDFSKMPGAEDDDTGLPNTDATDVKEEGFSYFIGRMDTLLD